MKRRTRWMIGLVGALLAAFAAAELFARFGLGLGDPPLSVADRNIEYLFKPSMRYRRFGNAVSYNAYSMRSPDFPKAKSDPSELRVLVFGDSVINGGSQTDQSQLATTLLRRRLAEELGRPAVVGNISAGSWGPLNQLAYAERFGFFDADVVVIVASSHDAADVPTFEPVVDVDPNFPSAAPVLALEEVFTRYLPRYFGSAPPADAPTKTGDDPAGVEASLGAIRELIGMARESGARVVIAQHLARDEKPGEEHPGYGAIRRLAEEMNVERVDLGPAFRSAAASGEHPYRDDIHPNALGQEVIGRALFDAVAESPAATKPAR